MNEKRTSETPMIPHIEAKILSMRGHRVMLDADLAEMYGVTTFNLNKAVKRNIERFPDDFMFQLSRQEYEDLKFQAGISRTHGGRRTSPYAFTEQGVAMLSSVLRSERAIRVNVEIMRAFVRIRQYLGAHVELARKIGELEKRIKTHDGEIALIFSAIHSMLHPATKKKRQIGFRGGADA